MTNRYLFYNLPFFSIFFLISLPISLHASDNLASLMTYKLRTIRKGFPWIPAVIATNLNSTMDSSPHRSSFFQVIVNIFSTPCL